MTSPLVDVIIPTRNRAELTQEAMESVRDQTVGSWRMWVIDDASDDGSADVLRRATQGDARITVCAHGERRGAQAARQSGYEAGQAPFVAFLDSDDLWLPSKLQAQLDLLESVSADAALCHHIWVEATGEERGPRRPFLDREDRLVSTNMSTILLRRSTIDKVGGMLPPGGRAFMTCEGIEFYLRLTPHCLFSSVPEVLVRCREHPGWRTSNQFKTGAAAEELAAVLAIHEDSLRARPGLRGHLHAQTGVRFLAARQRGTGLRHLAVGLDPRHPRVARGVLRRFGPAAFKHLVRSP